MPRLILPGERFLSDAVERVQSINKEDLTKYLWFFHQPLQASLVSRFIKRQLVGSALFIITMLTPWVIGLVSFQVAHSLCIFFVFAIAPLFLLVVVISHFIPGVPPGMKYLTRQFAAVSDFVNILATYFFLMAHDHALWNDLFVPPGRTESWSSWLLFLLDGVVEPLSFGASDDIGWKLSAIEPLSKLGGAVKFGFGLLIVASIVKAIVRTVRWYRGKDFFTGSAIEVIAECYNRKDAPGSYVTRVGRVESADMATFNVAALGAEAYNGAAAMITFFRMRQRPVYPKPNDAITFGEAASKHLGVVHVGIEEIRIGVHSESTTVVAIYHTQFVPTTEIRAELNLVTARLTVIFNGTQVIEILPVTSLRSIDVKNPIREVVLFQMDDMQLVGFRSCPLSVN